MSSKTWIIVFVVLSVVGINIIAMLNYMVDPYSIFDTNNFKKYYHNKYRITNSLILKREEFDTLIIGTSRTQRAINPSNKNLEGKTYNLSMPASNVYEIKQIFDFIVENQNNLDTIIYGVDFLTFSDKRYPRKQFKESLFSNKNEYYSTLLKILYSPETTKDSTRNIQYNINERASNYSDGYREKGSPKTKNLKKSFKKILTNNFLVNRENYACYNNSIERHEMFRDILNLTYKKNIKLKLFIPPLHYRQYMALYHLGLFDIYIDWIKDISKKVNEVNEEHRSNLIELYDFSNLNYITTEKIPDNNKDKMKYHFESSHYTSKTGDIILDRLYGKNSFGNQLNNINIDTYVLNKKKTMLEFFNKENSTLVEIEKLFIQTIKKRKANCSKYKNVLTKME